MTNSFVLFFFCFFSCEDCKFLTMILTNKYNLKTSVIKTGKPHQWRISIWKESLPRLVELVEVEVEHHFIAIIDN